MTHADRLLDCSFELVVIVVDIKSKFVCPVESSGARTRKKRKSQGVSALVILGGVFSMRRAWPRQQGRVRPYRI